MPTQPVVMPCNVNAMVSPFTAYVILYRSSDEDLVPEHTSVTDIHVVSNRCYIPCCVCTCV